MRPRIADEFADLEVSRQRRYQLRKKARGQCIQCGVRPALPEMTCCRSCHEARYLRVQKYQGKPANPRTNTKFSRAVAERG